MFAPHRLAALLLLTTLLLPASASAFDYIEHTFFTDRACREVQQRVGARIAAGDASHQTVSRYLALALTCPEKWDRPYCIDGYKQLEAGLNRLEEPPAASGDLAVTLGDFAALPDHMSQYGPIRRLERIGKSGLTYETWLWLTGEPGSAGGVIGDVAEDACETDGLVPWTRVEHDITRFLARTDRAGELDAVPGTMLTPVVRDPIPRGPTDPAGAYSFDNPHYLDLVLRNHHHFGQQAYSSWLGFHAAAISVAERSCADVVAFDEDQLEDLADDMPGYDEIDWDDLGVEQRRETGCRMMRDAVERRLLEWAERADPALVAPVADIVAALKADEAAAEVILDDVVAATTALVMEGAALHFLQDGLAGGHMRTIRSKEELGEVRYDHDLDNREGVVAILETRSGHYPYVAFGDSYMLGPIQVDQAPDCDWEQLAATRNPDPALVSTCLIQHQRGLLVATSTASLIDWIYGGTLYDAPNTAAAQAPAACQNDDPLHQFICVTLPARATMVAGEHDASGTVVSRMHRGSIPVPPPVFGYESLSIDVGLEATGDATQLGLHLNLLSELDDRANWLTSHRMGVRSTIGSGEFNQFLADYSYGFHWRWSARFMLDARAEVFGGLRGLDEDVAFFMGAAPYAGVTALPEGWTKLPLELTLGYRLPLTVYGGEEDQGFFGEGFVDGHWIMMGLGLAFM